MESASEQLVALSETDVLKNTNEFMGARSLACDLVCQISAAAAAVKQIGTEVKALSERTNSLA